MFRLQSLELFPERSHENTHEKYCKPRQVPSDGPLFPADVGHEAGTSVPPCPLEVPLIFLILISLIEYGDFP